MKLHELITSTDEQQILQAAAAIDEKNLDGYEVVLRRLKSLAPSTATGWSIVIAQNQPLLGEDAADHGGILDVYGREEGQSQRYAIEFTPWAEWLAMDVCVEGVDLTPAQMIAQCLYEMTFVGYDEDDIQEQRDEINRRVDEINDLDDEASPPTSG